MPMAESRPPIVVGIRVTKQRGQHRSGASVDAGIGAKAQQRHHRDQEDQRQAGEQHRQRDLVGRLLPLGALDQRDHPVEEGRRPARTVIAHLDPVRDHRRAAGDGASGRRRSRGSPARYSPVMAASLTEAMPSMTSPSAGITSPASTSTTSPTASSWAGSATIGRALSVDDQLGLGRHPRGPQGVGLRLAAALGDGLGEVGEQHGEPEPERDLQRRSPRRRRVGELAARRAR